MAAYGSPSFGGCPTATSTGTASDSWETEGGGADINGDGVIDLTCSHWAHARIIKTSCRDRCRSRCAQQQYRVTPPFATLPSRTRTKSKASFAFGTRRDRYRGNLRCHPTDTFPYRFQEVKEARFGTVAQRNAGPNSGHILAAKAQVYRYCLVQDDINFEDS